MIISSEFKDDVIEERQLAKARELGFRLTGHSLQLYGQCDKAECQEKSSGR